MRPSVSRRSPLQTDTSGEVFESPKQSSHGWKKHWNQCERVSDRADKKRDLKNPYLLSVHANLLARLLSPRRTLALTRARGATLGITHPSFCASRAGHCSASLLVTCSK